MLRINQIILSKPFRTVRKIVIFIVGITVLLLGIAMMVLPGPASLVIPAGLGILAIEFAWARIILKKAKELFKGAMDKYTSKRKKQGGDEPPTQT